MFSFLLVDYDFSLPGRVGKMPLLLFVVCAEVVVKLNETLVHFLPTFLDAL